MSDIRNEGVAPVILAPNQPLNRPYRGGSGIARFRGTAHIDPYTPEDFVGSSTEVFSGHGVGLTVLPDGRSLRDAIEADPLGYLGPHHVQAFGADPMLLVKLLSTDERLFVHYHPDAAFASAHLGRTVGKTEAWVVIDTDGPDAYALLGFNRPISSVEAEHWVTEQDVPDMVGAMNRVALATGDTLFVPAGVAHGIGPGVTLVELQEPTDLSILLEYQGFPGFTLSSALLGLDVRTAVTGLDRSLWLPEQLAVLGEGRGDGATHFPPAADRFFRARSVHVEGAATLAAGFAILVVVAGEGSLQAGAAAGAASIGASAAPLPLSLRLGRGMTVLVPFGAGEITLQGSLDVIVCSPPAPPRAT
ncbi:hypothetical protein [Subtercola vilae]|uniref:Mannose-6-phosphate isomerase n=1 Tax=Subtercola vilae TaxID=2056433 RepID=A0A4T2C9F0_9MICO|nr:hypothetical protein [Subtercola vilae]TIH40051.1 hypothetical protein D4765_02680 [Subtercola vilae]